MKEQLKSVVLPRLPIVGHLKLTTKDGESLFSIEVSRGPASKNLDPFFENCFKSFSDFLSGDKKSIKIDLDYSSLTDFQMKVLRAMKDIPYGEVATYKELAEKMHSRAYQAVGSACGRNPFLIIFPCHRVVGTNDLGGFAHGLRMKEELLDLEKKNT